MYGRSRKALVLLITLILAELGAMIVFFETLVCRLSAWLTYAKHIKGTNNPAPGLFICADADPPNVHWMAYVPAIILITEIILLGLAVFKAAQQFRAGIAGGRILPNSQKNRSYSSWRGS
jgi:hypothetical protein